jgi:FkbM family methyltransferase
LRTLGPVLKGILSSLPKARKAQLVDLALAHVAEASYLRLAQRGFCPNGIIDIGAYQGDWSRLVASIFPRVPILMVEGQSEKRRFLEGASTDIPLASYAMCLLGSSEGSEVIFNVMETGSSIYSERSNVPRVERTLKTRTLDNVLKEHLSLNRPLFIKLDVQGAEIDVLRGAVQALQRAGVVQLELALMPYNEGAPAANAVFSFMEEQGFLLFDVCGFVRPNPAYLTQIDVLFVPRDSPLRSQFFNF